MLALSLGALPMSVIASERMADCDMSCCTGKPAHQVADETCNEGCDDRETAPKASIRAEGVDEACDCSISSAPNNPLPVVLNTPGESGPKFPVATLPIPPLTLLDSCEPRAESLIFGSDLSPPVQIVDHASLGRAPPVRFA